MSVIMYPNVGALHEIGLIRADLALCKVKLFQNPVTLSPSTILANLTEATYGGYVAITVTALLAAYIDPVGGASAQIATIQFQCDGTAPSNIIYGFWVETAAGVLILAGTFDSGIPMALATDAIPVDVKFNFGN